VITGLDRLIEKFAEMFRTMPGDIDADLLHRPDGKRVNMAGRL
jgi:hypothetical protein